MKEELFLFLKMHCLVDEKNRKILFKEVEEGKEGVSSYQEKDGSGK